MHLKNGYQIIKALGHHRANSKGWVRVHIIVAEEALGRHLRNGEVVHHINGIKDDNRIGNLRLLLCGVHNDRIECPYCHEKFEIKKGGE